MVWWRGEILGIATDKGGQEGEEEMEDQITCHITSTMCTNLPEPPRDRKKEKNIQHTGNVPLDQIYDVSLFPSTPPPFYDMCTRPSSHLSVSSLFILHHPFPHTLPVLTNRLPEKWPTSLSQRTSPVESRRSSVPPNQ
jgi:hypothetical protein